MTSDLAHRSAFASRGFRNYYPASIFSTLGSWVLRFLLGWSAWELTESATWVGVTAGLMLAPALVLSPLFGIVADRINPRNGLLMTVTLHSLLALTAGLASAANALTLPMLLLVALGLGITTSAHTPIRLALVPSLVPRASLPSAIGYSAMTFNVSRILGPALGAWLLQGQTVTAAYLFSCALTLLALPFILVTPGRRTEGEQSGDSGLFAQLRDGLSYTRNHATIKLILVSSVINALLGRTVIELLPALSGKLLSGDATTLAQLTASAGVGSILGGLLVSRQGGGHDLLMRLFRLSLGLSAVLLIALAWPGPVTLFALIIGCISLLTTIAGTTSQALAQLQVEDAYRGRVMSLWTMITMGAPALGAMIMGGLADRWGFAPALLGFGLAGLAVVTLLRRADR